MAEPSFLSSIPPLTPARDHPVRLRDRSHLAKYLVHAQHPVQSIRYGQSSTIGEVLVAGTRPGEWLLLGNRMEALRLAESAADIATRVDFTHGRALLSIEGPKAANALAKLCDLDLSDHMTPNGAVASGYVAGVVCDLIRRDEEGESAYLLLFDRSYGPYMSSVLETAMAEFISDVGAP